MGVGQEGPEGAIVGRAGALVSSLAGKYKRELGCADDILGMDRLWHMKKALRHSLPRQD